MILAARWRPLGPGAAAHAVRFDTAALDELAGYKEGERLLVEIAGALSTDPIDAPGHRARWISGFRPLRRYRPRLRSDLRVLYAVERSTVFVLAIHPRDRAYRPGNLPTALLRFERMRAEG